MLKIHFQNFYSNLLKFLKKKKKKIQFLKL
jgi:hypothetical protein